MPAPGSAYSGAADFRPHVAPEAPPAARSGGGAGERGHGFAPVRCLEPAGDLFSDDSGSGDDGGGTGWQGGELWCSAELDDDDLIGRGGVCSRVAPRAAPSADFSRDDESADQSEAAPRTTVMLQRIANHMDEAAVGDILEQRGLGTFTAVYVPRNRKKNTNLAYAFVDFALPEHAELCIHLCEGRPFGDTDRICSVAYSTSQGHAVVAGRMNTELTKRRLRAAATPPCWAPPTPWVGGPPPGLGFEQLACT